ncbi:probable glutamate receptor [Rhinatrema bivittatum]|uniref:probable glutamate receptor n=1 Tax=Rhinatrema bivittatum TaxID=194408 RepID=UPI001127801C|nr:probable glutamate receptor [Rhinatrema bivittatum]XP_029434543.1 probable glutamate receptor [Rhinatrema bivittatum]
MTKAFRLLICVTALLLLKESSPAGAEENQVIPDKANKNARTKRQSQQTLAVTTILERPFTMNKDSKLEGYCIDLLSELSKKVGFQYEVNVVKDGKYGMMDSDGNWSGMVGEVIRKEADMAVAPLTITSVREQTISFTKPFIQTGISILLKRDTTAEGLFLFRFLNPFSRETWLGILIAYLVTCVCLFLVGRLSPIEWKEPQSEENKFTFLNSLWFGAGALTLQGAEPHPKALSARIIATVWWIFTIFLLAAYIASFAAFLNSGSQQTPTIQTFEDLVKQKSIAFGTIQGSSTFNFFKNSKSPTFQMIYEYMEKKKDLVLVKTFEEGVQRVKESSYALLGESVMQDLAVAKHCDLIRAPEIVGRRGYGIATMLDSPLVRNLSIAVLELSESGHLDYLYKKWWQSSCSDKGNTGWIPLQAQTLGGIFLLLAAGLVLGVIVSLIELVSKAKNSADQQNKSCCSTFSEELGRRFKGASESQEESEKVQP